MTVIIMKIDKSLLLTRQGEELAERQLRHREVSVGRKPMEFKGPVPKNRVDWWNLKGLSLKIELTGAEVETDCLSV